MASNGTGYRLAADLLCEISLHLVESFCFTPITSIQPGGYGDGGYGDYPYGDGPPNAVIFPESTNAMYVGAQIVVGWQAEDAEVVTITQIGSDGSIATTPLANSHAAGDIILAPTFPTQQPTDPLFTQQEMLGYIARAQNEFLSMVSCIYAIFTQSAQYGQVFQNLPQTAIQIDRVAASTFYQALTSLVRTGGVVTGTTSQPHGLAKGLTPYVYGAVDDSFDGTIQVLTVPTTTTFTYAQDGDDASTTGGALIYWLRLYETTQAEITMVTRTWFNDYMNAPAAWFEDRSGLYRWGFNGKPSSNFPIEMLCSIRDTDTLGLLDGFLVQDIYLHYVKYKAMEYIFSKDGVRMDPQRAAYCKDRFDRGVATVLRYITGMQMGLKN